MKRRTLASIATTLLIPCMSFAAPASEELGRCLADNTSGKDRKDLAKWIFVGMSAHPDMRAIAVVDPKSVEASQRKVAELVTRLIGTSCTSEMRAVVKTEGANGARAGFEHLGKMAMQELMGNAEVNATIGGFERYLDQSKLEPAMRSK